MLFIIGCLGNVAVAIGLALLGCEPLIGSILLIISVSLGGIFLPVYSNTCTDIASEYGLIIFGMAQTGAMVAGIIFPLFANAIASDVSFFSLN